MTTPEEARAAVLAEELSKGSDPRVAEARSKAAEARARQGYPIDPHEAWKVKLEKESGRAPSEAPPPTEAPPAPVETPPPAPVAVPDPAPQVAEVEAPLVVEAPQVVVEVAFEPEFGQLLEPADEDRWTEIGGVKVRDARIPNWLMVALIAIPLWAVVYLMAFGSADVDRATTGCIVGEDQTFTCFHAPDEAATSPGH